jgi:hypothetical protein
VYVKIAARMTNTIPRNVAERARQLRQKRRTRTGLKGVRAVERWKPWAQVRAELAAEGLGSWPAEQLVDAVARLPLAHPNEPTAQEHDQVERSWRDGWAADFPGEPWPGLAEARRRLKLAAATGSESGGP